VDYDQVFVREQIRHTLDREAHLQDGAEHYGIEEQEHRHEKEALNFNMRDIDVGVA